MHSLRNIALLFPLLATPFALTNCGDDAGAGASAGGTGGGGCGPGQIACGQACVSAPKVPWTATASA